MHREATEIGLQVFEHAMCTSLHGSSELPWGLRFPGQDSSDSPICAAGLSGSGLEPHRLLLRVRGRRAVGRTEEPIHIDSGFSSAVKVDEDHPDCSVYLPAVEPLTSHSINSIIRWGVRQTHWRILWGDALPLVFTAGSVLSWAMHLWSE